MSAADMTVMEKRALEGFKEHHLDKKKIEKEFNDQLNYLEEGNALIVMDFKANMSLGRGPEEDSHVFFNAPQRTVFGAVAYLKKNGVKFKIIFTIFSKILNHDSKTVREFLFNCILNHNIFKKFDVKSLHFWMDNAPNHFRTKETIATFFEIQEKFGFSVNFHYFAEYHGKSECDRHFGLISRMYSEHTSTNRGKLCSQVNTTEELLEMYKNGICSYGGLLISEKTTMAEIHPEISTKLNVASFIHHLSDLTENFENHNRAILPYNSRKFKEMTRFNFNSYFSFEFKNEKLLCRLVGKKLKSLLVPFSIKEKLISNYQVKIGDSTALQPKFGSLSRTLRRLNYHSQNE
jgi:hypothetical protein